MKKFHSLRLFALLSVVAVGQTGAYTSRDGGPLDHGSWYLLPKIGVAPAIFTSRGYEHRIVPRSGVTCPLTCDDEGEVFSCGDILTSPADIYQQNSCKVPKFNELWSNGVLHVGGEIGYVADCHCTYFVDLIYNRASGSCVHSESKNFRASTGCASNDCSTTPSGDALSTSARDDAFSNYTAFGAYLGNRYFFNRIWCDRLAFFLGGKVGLQRRNSVCVTSSNIVQNEVTIPDAVTATAICTNTAVSGGLQVGVDYCINDCFAVLVGVEVVATSPLKVSNNVPLDIPSASRAQVFPSNLLPGATGTVLQFPVWVGLSWEWDWCCDRSC